MSSTVLLHSIGFGLTTAAVISIGAMGFTLQLGVTNVLNISYGNVMTIGAFASLIVERQHLGLVARRSLLVQRVIHLVHRGDVVPDPPACRRRS